MKQVTIYLGSHCNLQCPYCHRQAGADEQKGLPTDFFVRLQALQKDGPLKVKFMGGEPTLYFSAVQKVVQTVPKAHFAIATNGVDLDKYLPYFRQHDFLLCLSYDGAPIDVRGHDPLSHLLDYPKLAISTTIYHGNTDFRAILQRFAEKEKVIGRPLGFFPHIVHHTAKDNAPYALTHEDYQLILRQWKELILELLDGYNKGIINWALVPLFRGLFERLEANYQYGETYCVHRGLEKVGPDGKPVSCLYIRDLHLTSRWLEEQAAMIEYMFPKCRKCPVYGMCGGGCHKSLDHELECDFYFNLYSWFQNLADKNSVIWRLGDAIDQL